MKLIRDGYVGITPADQLDTTIKSPEQKLNLILDKIKEEATEYLESSQRDPNELADLMQVIVDWGNMNGYSFDLVNHLRKEKYNKLGGFENFVVLKEETQDTNQDT